LERVIVVRGAQQGIGAAAQVLLNPGDAAWVEEPGYFGAKGALLGAGARLVPVPIDAEGLDAARLSADTQPPGLEQLVLAEFITKGLFARRIRRMRTLYAERQAALVDAARQLSGALDVRPDEAGMHLLGWLPGGSDDRAIAQLAERYRVSTRPLSRFFLEPSAQRALLLGYAAVPIPAIQEGVRRLAAALAHARAAS
jgi:GntR family transcriptional regulator/MocR family aminotransferase